MVQANKNEGCNCKKSVTENDLQREPDIEEEKTSSSKRSSVDNDADILQSNEDIKKVLRMTHDIRNGKADVYFEKRFGKMKDWGYPS